MAKERVQTSTEALRPLDLDPERAKRTHRPPYAIVDIGSNSIRLLVYDQLGRAPMPRFNEKSLARLAEGLAETGAIAPDHFRRAVEAVRRLYIGERETMHVLADCWHCHHRRGGRSSSTSRALGRLVAVVAAAEAASGSLTTDDPRCEGASRCRR